MSPAGEAEKAKTRLAAMGSLTRPVLMSWAWILCRSLMVVHCLSSMERYGCSEMNLEMEVEVGGDGICDQQQKALIFCFSFLFN